MNNKKHSVIRIAAAVLMLAVLMSLCGCSKMSSAESMTEPMYDSAVNGSYGFDDYYFTDSAAGVVENSTAAPESAEPQESPDTLASEESQQTIERKIIRDASIDIEAEDAQSCYHSILEYVKELGGYESSCSTNTNDYGSSRYIYIDAEFRLPPEKLDEFTGKVGDFGEVTYLNVSSEEITEEYYDLETRMKSKEAAMQSYYTLLEKAETVDEILIIQSKIDEITEEIESIKGRLRVYDALVDESRVYLCISEYAEVAPSEKEFEWDSLTASDVGKLIKNGFLSVCNFVWSLLQWICIIVISASPLLAVAGAVLFVVLKIKKHRAKKAPAKTENTKKEDTSETEKGKAPDYK